MFIALFIVTVNLRAQNYYRVQDGDAYLYTDKFGRLCSEDTFVAKYGQDELTKRYGESGHFKSITISEYKNLSSDDLFGWLSASEMYDLINGEFAIDDNGNVSYVHIISVPDLSADDIYVRAASYFTYNYGSGKSVIQIDDKEKGIIVGKGLYPQVHIALQLMQTTTVDAWHILRIDIKDGRARAILTLSQYEKAITIQYNTTHQTTFISSEYPINPKGRNKTAMMKSFYKTHCMALMTIDRLENAIKYGSVSASLEGDDW